MSIVRRQDVWDPFRELVNLQEELSRVFEPAVLKGAPEGGKTEWHPGVDIVEDEDRIVVRTDLPGMKQEDIQVEVADGVLTIRGERKLETEASEGKYRRVERAHGTFVRSFAVPATVDPLKVGAAYKSGVLEVTLPKREEIKPKLIKVDVK